MPATMRRLDLLIKDVRDRTGNTVYDVSQGVSQREMISYANEAQARLYNLLANEHTSLFMKEAFLSSVANQAAYTLPTDIHFLHNILKVDYSSNGSAVNYAPLTLRSPKQEESAAGYPTSYFLRHGTMIVSPIPSSTITNAFRLNYQYTVPALDIRRGKVTALTAISGTTYDITLDTGTYTAPTSETVADWTNGTVDAACVVGATGSQYATGLTVISWTASTNKLRVSALSSSAATLISTAIAASTPLYVTGGDYHSTHSSLPVECERYLLAYMTLRLGARDTNSVAAQLTGDFFKAMEKEILDAASILEEDISAIAILDASMLDYGTNTD